MLNRFYNTLEKWTKPPILWSLGIATALFLIAFNLLQIPEQLAKLLGYSGSQRLYLLDMSFNYSPEWVYTTLSNYGEAGRRSYLVMSLGFDYIFPVIYGLFFSLSLIGLLKQVVPARTSWQKLGLVALLGALADLLENLAILGLLLAYPQKLEVVATIANIFTLAKDFLLGAVGLALLGLLAAFWYKKLKQPKETVPGL